MLIAYHLKEEINMSNTIKNKLIKFGASWCSPCKQAAKHLSENYSPEQYIDVDVTVETELAQSFGIRNVPTFVLVDDNGDEVSRFTGFEPLKIKEAIESL